MRHVLRSAITVLLNRAELQGIALPQQQARGVYGQLDRTGRSHRRIQRLADWPQRRRDCGCSQRDRVGQPSSANGRDREISRIPSHLRCEVVMAAVVECSSRRELVRCSQRHRRARRNGNRLEDRCNGRVHTNCCAGEHSAYPCGPDRYGAENTLAAGNVANRAYRGHRRSPVRIRRYDLKSIITKPGPCAELCGRPARDGHGIRGYR